VEAIFLSREFSTNFFFCSLLVLSRWWPQRSDSCSTKFSPHSECVFSRAQFFLIGLTSSEVPNDNRVEALDYLPPRTPTVGLSVVRSFLSSSATPNLLLRDGFMVFCHHLGDLFNKNIRNVIFYGKSSGVRGAFFSPGQLILSFFFSSLRRCPGGPALPLRTLFLSDAR